MTAKTLKEDVLRGFKIGADDYLTKPFDSEVLLAKIKAILNRKNFIDVPETKENIINLILVDLNLTQNFVF